MPTKTLAQLRTACRNAIDQNAASSSLDTILDVWINEELEELWGQMTRWRPRRFLKASSNIVVSSGNTFVITSTAADYLDFYAIDVQRGAAWEPLFPLQFQLRGVVSDRRYHLEGSTVRILPEQYATGTYRVWYVPSNPVLVAAGDSVALPVGGTKYIAEGVAARWRDRKDDDPTPHERRQQRALERARAWVQDDDLGHPDQLVDLASVTPDGEEY